MRENLIFDLGGNFQIYIFALDGTLYVLTSKTGAVLANNKPVPGILKYNNLHTHNMKSGLRSAGQSLPGLQELLL